MHVSGYRYMNVPATKCARYSPKISQTIAPCQAMKFPIKRAA